MGITGPKGSPTKVGPGVGDTLPAALTAFGIMAAVYRANKTGKGQFVDVAMYDAVLAFCERILYQYSYTGDIPGPEGNGHPLLCPFGLFPVRDGLVAIACPMDQFWGPLARAMGRADLVDHPAVSNQRSPRGAQRRGRCVDLGVDVDANEGADENSSRRPGAVRAGARRRRHLRRPARSRARHAASTSTHPGLERAARIAGTPIKMTGTPGGVRGRAPLLGEHTCADPRGTRLCRARHRINETQRSHFMTSRTRYTKERHPPRPPLPALGTGQQQKDDAESPRRSISTTSFSISKTPSRRAQNPARAA